MRGHAWKKRIAVLKNGCWQWVGHRDGEGYARATIGLKSGLAHRLVYEAVRGSIPAGMTLDHLCHSRDPACLAGSSCPHRSCVNPDHLEPVGMTENTRRANRRLPPAKSELRTRCPNNHELTLDNTYIAPDGARICRVCQRAAVAAYRRKKAIR